MRDEQVRRYSRHIKLKDIGGLGQTALLVARAKIILRESEPRAELVAGAYLAAGGVGRIVVSASNEAQRAEIAAHGPDSKIVESGDGREVQLAPKPAWWPSAEGDDIALAYWRGAIAATTWMNDTISRS
jgi:hypothetical protein